MDQDVLPERLVGAFCATMGVMHRLELDPDLFFVPPMDEARRWDHSDALRDATPAGCEIDCPDQPGRTGCIAGRLAARLLQRFVMVRGARVRYDWREEEYEVVGHGNVHPDLAPIGIIGAASVAALKRAVRKRLSYGGDTTEVFRVTEFDDPDAPYEPYDIVVSDRGCAIVLFGPPCSEISKRKLMGVARALCKRRGCTSLMVTERSHDRQPWWEVSLVPPQHGRIVADYVPIATDLLALMDAASCGGLAPATTIGLLRGRRPELLIGLRESEWLEVKSAPYDLARTDQKIELAQDVARFANSESAGLIVVGLRAVGSGADEVITKCVAIPTRLLNAKQYRSVIDARVFPPIEGLEAECVETSSGRGLLFVHVPRQAEELKPFLVHGAIVNGKSEGAFISIVRRRGEASIPISGAAIHSMLAAGRALLRGTTVVGGERRRRRRSKPP